MSDTRSSATVALTSGLIVSQSHAQAPAPGTLIPFPAISLSPLSPPDAPRPRIPTSNPDAFLPDLGPYSLLEDVRQQQGQHAAGSREKVTLYGFPGYLSTNLRRVLARSKAHRADWACALSCLLFQGLSRYSGLPVVRDLVTALSALDTDDGLDAVAAEQIETWRRGFRFQVQDPTHTLGLERVRAWKAPEHVHTELHDLAGRLGLSGSVLGIASVAAALQDQEGVLGAHAGYMRACVEELDGLLGERARRLRALVRAIEAGVWR